MTPDRWYTFCIQVSLIAIPRVNDTFMRKHLTSVTHQVCTRVHKKNHWVVAITYPSKNLICYYDQIFAHKLIAAWATIHELGHVMFPHYDGWYGEHGPAWAACCEQLGIYTPLNAPIDTALDKSRWVPEVWDAVNALPDPQQEGETCLFNPYK